jgi:hypothetical protein
MWLIISSMAAMAVTAAYLFISDKYRIGVLGLALWGLTACIFVDHTMAYLMEGGGEYLEIGVEPLVLSITMLIPLFAIWEMYVLVIKLREKHLSKYNEEIVKECA